MGARCRYGRHLGRLCLPLGLAPQGLGSGLGSRHSQVVRIGYGMMLDALMSGRARLDAMAGWVSGLIWSGM